MQLILPIRSGGTILRMGVVPPSGKGFSIAPRTRPCAGRGPPARTSTAPAQADGASPRPLPATRDAGAWRTPSRSAKGRRRDSNAPGCRQVPANARRRRTNGPLLRAVRAEVSGGWCSDVSCRGAIEHQLPAASTSTWAVITVIHEWPNPTERRVEVWRERIGSARRARPAGSELTCGHAHDALTPHVQAGLPPHGQRARPWSPGTGRGLELDPCRDAPDLPVDHALGTPPLSACPGRAPLRPWRGRSADR